LRTPGAFEGLAVAGLAAVAAVAGEVDSPVQEVVLQDGAPDDTLFLGLGGRMMLDDETDADEHGS
jgi:hypothetical protein